MTAAASSREQFSQRVAELRQQQELTQAELGRKVGVSGTCVWNWEGGNTYPRPGALRRLAEALGTNVPFLAGELVNVTPTGLSAGRNSTKSLAEIIMEARQAVAAAAGVPVNKVRVVIDCGD